DLGKYFYNRQLARQRAGLRIQAITNALLRNFAEQLVLGLVIRINELLSDTQAFCNVVELGGFVSFFIKEAAGRLHDALAFQSYYFAFQGRTLRRHYANLPSG